MTLIYKRINNFFWRPIDILARRHVLSIILVGLLSFGGSWLWAQFRGIPVPHFLDEYSYLLAADTFAHGRVTNLTHPMWLSFETFFVLQHPTYMSMYPPAQGAFLAFGKVFLGHPIYGVWISSALMCAAICWMLYAWVSPRWALVGGLVSVIQFGIFTFWSQSYWGGAVAAMGGALIFGALPRIFKTQRIRDALWLGLGLTVLVNSRPLEGFLVAIPVSCLVLPWKIRWEKLVLVKFFKKIILPLGLVVAIAILGMGLYNKKITGDARTFPQFLYLNTATSVPIFIFQSLHPVHFNSSSMSIYEQDRPLMRYNYKRTWEGVVKSIQINSYWTLVFFFGYPLAIPSLAILALFFSRRQVVSRFVLAFLILLFECATITYDLQPQYFASETCLVVLLITIGLRKLSWLKAQKVRVGLILVVFLIFIQLGINIFLTPHMPPTMSLAKCIQAAPANPPKSFNREELKDFLLKKGGKYLVIVEYTRRHNCLWEWVHNDADIDHAPIVWARDLDAVQNARLLEYFKDRQVLFIKVYWDRFFRYPIYQDRLWQNGDIRFYPYLQRGKAY